VLAQLLAAPSIDIIGVVTTPPHPAGRKKELKKTPVHIFAEENNLPVFTPKKLDLATLQEITEKKPDFLLTAGYGKLLPDAWLTFPAAAALNLHFSLLPKFRGANPAEWALLMDEKETGVTVIEMSPSFDTGAMVSQQAIPITNDDTRGSIYSKLYEIGGSLLVKTLPKYLAYKAGDDDLGKIDSSNGATDISINYFFPAQPQADSSPTPYAKRLNRDDGFFKWTELAQVMAGEVGDVSSLSPAVQKSLAASQQKFDAKFVDQAVRALAGFPGVWTKIKTAKGEKRMKILQVSLGGNANSDVQTLKLIKVQIEGQSPANWNQVKLHYI
jgi:methionyl-tRNA formyltransferase